MKKLFSIISLALSLAIFTPTNAPAIGACVYYWSPNTAFFRAGGAVQVYHSDGSSYGVTGSNVQPGGTYSFSNGDTVLIYPPSCAVWTWGYSYFCECNTTGGLNCDPPNAQTVGGATMLQLSAYISCGCPTGSSDAALHFVYQKYCQAGGGGGQ